MEVQTDHFFDVIANVNTEYISAKIDYYNFFPLFLGAWHGISRMETIQWKITDICPCQDSVAIELVILYFVTLLRLCQVSIWEHSEMTCLVNRRV